MQEQFVMAIRTNTITLAGYGNTVNALSVATTTTGPATVTATSYGVTTIGSDIDQTITAGPGADTVTVGNADDNNTISGSQGSTSVTLGNGANTITLGGFGNTIVLGSGANTVVAGAGSENVTITGAVGYTDTITANGWGDNFNFTDGTYIVGGMSGAANFTLNGWANNASSIDLLNTAGDTFTAVSGGLQVNAADGSRFATFTTSNAANLAVTSDGSGGTLITLLRAPTITGYSTANQATSNEATVRPFAGITFTDPNAGSPTETVTVTMTGAGGTFSGLGTPSGSVYTITGTSALMQVVLRTAVFRPTAGAAGSVNTTHFTVTDTSSSGGPAVSSTANAITVVNTDSAVAPTITGSVAAQRTFNQGPVSLFSNVVIHDTNGGSPTETLSIVLSGSKGGTLADGSSFHGTSSLTSADATHYQLTGTAAAVTAELEALVFTPASAGGGVLASTETFTLTDVSSVGGTSAADSTTTVINTDTVAPTISGVTTAAQASTSESTVTPFASIVIADTNVTAGTPTDTATVTVNGAGGTFSGLGVAAGNVYTVTGTAAAVQAALRAAIFTPTAGLPHSTNTTTFTVADTSSFGGAATPNSLTTVVDTDPAVAPTITGAVLGQQVYNEGVSAPFAGVTVADTNYGATSDTLTITLSGGGGTLAGTGLTAIDATHYSLTGLASLVTTQLQALLFTPTSPGGAPNSATTTFALSDSSASSGWTGAAATATASVIDTDANGNDIINLSGFANTVIAPGSNATNSGPTTLNYTGWNNTIVANALNDTINAGSGSAAVTVGAANGNHTISGSQGLTSVTLGNGNNNISLSGWANTVSLGNGNNYVVGSSGGSTAVTVGTGSNNIALSGYANTVTVGTSVNAAGTNTINAGAGCDTLNLWNSTNNVTLNGWANIVNLHAGTDTFVGGNGTQFNVLTAAVNLNITDFGAEFADVVNYHALAGAGALTGAASGSNTLLTWTPTVGSASVTTLNGTGGASLAALISAGRVVI